MQPQFTKSVDRPAPRADQPEEGEARGLLDAAHTHEAPERQAQRGRVRAQREGAEGAHARALVHGEPDQTSRRKWRQHFPSAQGT